MPSQQYFGLQGRVATLQGALWKAIQDTGERNVSVILSALANSIKRVSDISLDQESNETESGS